MRREKYKQLHEKLNKIAGEIGTLAEGKVERDMLAFTYRRLADAMDAFVMVGEGLGYINPETGEWTDRRFKKDRELTKEIA